MDHEVPELDIVDVVIVSACVSLVVVGIVGIVKEIYGMSTVRDKKKASAGQTE